MSARNSTNRFKIDAAFRDYLPKQTKEQTDNLTAKILTEGALPGSLTVGVIDGERYLIDGHHTFGVCEANDIPLPTERILDFESREDAQLWMIRNQDSRRNWTKAERDYVLGKEFEVTKKIEGRPNKEEPILRQNDGVSRETAERLAKERKVSPRTVERAAQFAAAVDKIGIADPETKTAILNGKATKSQKGNANKVKITKAEVIAVGDARCDKCRRFVKNPAGAPGCSACAAKATEMLARKRPAKAKGEACPHCGGTGRV